MLIAHDGKVYDVTASFPWAKGSHWGELRADMRVSNLRRYIEALGGTLEITARFEDASVVLDNIG